MERAEGRDPVIEESSQIPAPLSDAARSRRRRRGGRPTVDVEDAQVDVEQFPVMVRLRQIQSEIRWLAARIEEIHGVLDRMAEQSDERAPIVRQHAVDESDPIPAGITARANPMTHPAATQPASGATDASRDEMLASVRALFTMRRRPWWQRLPDLLRG